VNVIVYDTETTGLTIHPKAPLERQPRMIEFGAVLVDAETGEVVEEASMLIDPEMEIEEQITRITGITPSDLHGQPRFRDVLPELRRLFGEAQGVVAHNLPFDKTILHCELARAECTDFPWPQAELCTVQLFRDEWGRNPKLTELYQHILGEPLAQTHRALDDVRALVRIMKAASVWQFLS